MDTQRVDEKFITHIVNTYSDMILRIAYQYTPNRFDAEDIAQNVFLSLIKKNLRELSEEELKAYIIRCAVNKCKDFHRRRTRRQTVPLEDAQDLFSPEEESILDEVRSLPARYRDVIYLYYYEGYTLNQIGKILSLNPNTVSTRLRRARKKLKAILQEEIYE